MWRRLLAAVAGASLLAGCGHAAHPADPPRPRPIAQPPLGQGVAGVRLLVYPDDAKRLLTRPMRAARHSLDLVTYLLTDHTMIRELEYAHAKGVRVRVILERHPFGQDVSGPGANQSAFDQLYAADIPVRWASGRFRLTHEKAMVIDDVTAYILSLNFTHSAFGTNREFGAVDAEPRDVAEVEALFDADWRDAAYAPHDPNLIVSPTNSRARLLALLARARHSVEVYAEEVQDSGMEDALAAAARRRVRVRLISNAGDATNAVGLARLRPAGVQIRLLTSPYIHAKMFLVDDRWAFVGSENISTSSLDANRELGVLIADPDALARLAETFATDWHAPTAR